VGANGVVGTTIRACGAPAVKNAPVESLQPIPRKRSAPVGARLSRS